MAAKRSKQRHIEDIVKQITPDRKRTSLKETGERLYIDYLTPAVNQYELDRLMDSERPVLRATMLNIQKRNGNHGDHDKMSLDEHISSFLNEYDTIPNDDTDMVSKASSVPSDQNSRILAAFYSKRMICDEARHLIQKARNDEDLRKIYLISEQHDDIMKFLGEEGSLKGKGIDEILSSYADAISTLTMHEELLGRREEYVGLISELDEKDPGSVTPEDLEHYSSRKEEIAALQSECEGALSRRDDESVRSFSIQLKALDEMISSMLDDAYEMRRRELDGLEFSPSDDIKKDRAEINSRLKRLEAIRPYKEFLDSRSPNLFDSIEDYLKENIPVLDQAEKVKKEIDKLKRKNKDITKKYQYSSNIDEAIRYGVILEDIGKMGELYTDADDMVSKVNGNRYIDISSLEDIRDQLDTLAESIRNYAQLDLDMSTTRMANIEYELKKYEDSRFKPLIPGKRLKRMRSELESSYRSAIANEKVIRALDDEGWVKDDG